MCRGSDACSCAGCCREAVCDAARDEAGGPSLVHGELGRSLAAPGETGRPITAREEAENKSPPHRNARPECRA